MRWIIAAPLLVILVLFTLSNRQSVQFGLWPTDYSLDMPLAIAVLAAMAFAFLLGALFVWPDTLRQRRRARRAERRVRLLETQLEARVAAETPPATSLDAAPPAALTLDG